MLWRDVAGTRNLLERPNSTKAALNVDTVGVASKFAHGTLRIPKIWNRRLHLEGANARRRASNLGKVPCSAKAAVHMLPIGATSVHPRLAHRIPEVRRRCWAKEIACNGGRRLRDAIGALNAGKWVPAAETTLSMSSIGPATQHTRHARRLPIVGNGRLPTEKAATRGWARGVARTPAKSALKIFSIREAVRIIDIAHRVPKIPYERGLMLELACLRVGLFTGQRPRQKRRKQRK